MGCEFSADASNPSGNDFNMENGKQRVRIDKTTGEVVDASDPREIPEGAGMFEEVDAGQGDQFMAVKPWIGAVKEPTSHPPVDPTPPNVRYELEYVYGYRCEDSRQNVYFNSKGDAVYMTAALGVILEPNSNTQKFFGGGMVDMKAKNVSDDLNCHTDDITSINISSDRRLAASGQVGSSPCAFVWDAQTGQKQQRFKLPKGARGIDSIAISNDGSLVAMVDRHDQHNVYVFEVASGQLVGKDVGDVNKIFDICFSAKAGDNKFVTAGIKHIKFWDANPLSGKKGIFGGAGEQTSFACAAFDDQGVCYAGGANGLIYVWQGSNLKTTISPHQGGFIGALRFSEGKVYSGGKDGNMCIINPGNLSVEKMISFNGILIRAIDVKGGQALVGLRSGTIYKVDIATEQKNAIMMSHSDGEVWGLNIPSDDLIITTADDNQILAWNPKQRKLCGRGTVSTTARALKRRGASTLSQFPDSQCSRAVAYNPFNGHVAVGHNDGTLTIRAGVDKLDQIIATNTNSKEWIEAIQYSPDGSKLAVGSHDNNIYIYETGSYGLVAKCTKHNSFIVSVDWSLDGQYIRSVCGAHELLFFNGNSGQQDPNGASNTVSTQWATHSAKFGWLVDGVFPSGTDGTHINHVAFSKDQTVIATADDYGLVNLFRNPCRKGHKPISLRGHSEHVVRVGFNSDDSYLYSIGGYDQTLMQWKRL